MKCFYHEDRSAVATCQHCGKALCKECAARYTPCFCEECAEILRKEERSRTEAQKQERARRSIQALADTRGEFIKTLLTGFAPAALYLVYGVGSLGLPFGEQFPVAVCIFFIPFGWRLISYGQAEYLFWATSDGFTALLILAFKAILSVLIGIPAFLYQLVRTISNQRKISQLRKQSAEVPAGR